MARLPIVLRAHLVTLAIGALAACGGSSGDPADRDAAAAESSSTRAASQFPTAPKCRKPAATTPAQTEGPYYKAGPPRRRSLLAPGVRGRRLLLRGRVLSTDCRPLAEARVDFWQADGVGAYDSSGFRLRGFQRTDAKGRYRVETVVPGRYENRTRHIHVKVTPRGGETLTTQLYFPGETANRRDFIFDRETLVRLKRATGVWRAAFDFVVEGG